MGAQGLVGLAAAAWILVSSSLAHAQCTKDTDCKGDRVCEDGACVASTATPAPAPSPAPAAAAPAPEPAVNAPPAASSPEPLPMPDEPPRRRRHSTGMMVGGIVMTSLAPVALLVAAVANNEQTYCELGIDAYDNAVRSCDDYDSKIYGGLILGVALAGAGIPLIVIGAKKEPVTARITPWATARSAGLGLRIEM